MHIFDIQRGENDDFVGFVMCMLCFIDFIASTFAYYRFFFYDTKRGENMCLF